MKDLNEKEMKAFLSNIYSNSCLLFYCKMHSDLRVKCVFVVHILHITDIRKYIHAKIFTNVPMFHKGKKGRYM